MTALLSFFLQRDRVKAVSYSFTFLAFFVPLFLMVHSSGIAVDYPFLSGRVVDEVNLLTPATTENLETLSGMIEKQTTLQLVVVVLKNLRGQTIEEYGIALARRWQIGQKEKNNGVLLILAPTEREVRIEVGYGLEGELTDAVSKWIIDKKMIPLLKANDPDQALLNGAEAIATLFMKPEDFKKEFQENNGNEETSAVLVFLFLFFLILFLRFFILRRKNGKDDFWGGFFGPGGGSGGGFGGGGGGFGGGGASGKY
jgi:uncharacterized protein